MSSLLEPVLYGVFTTRLILINAVFLIKFFLAKINLTPLLVVSGLWFGAQLVWLVLVLKQHWGLKRVWNTISFLETNNKRQAQETINRFSTTTTRDGLFELTQANCYLGIQEACANNYNQLLYLDPNHPTTHDLGRRFFSNSN